MGENKFADQCKTSHESFEKNFFCYFVEPRVNLTLILCSGKGKGLIRIKGMGVMND